MMVTVAWTVLLDRRSSRQACWRRWRCTATVLSQSPRSARNTQ